MLMSPVAPTGKVLGTLSSCSHNPSLPWLLQPALYPLLAGTQNVRMHQTWGPRLCTTDKSRFSSRGRVHPAYVVSSSPTIIPGSGLETVMLGRPKGLHDPCRAAGWECRDGARLHSKWVFGMQLCPPQPVLVGWQGQGLPWCKADGTAAVCITGGTYCWV